MKFRTEIPSPKYPFSINYDDSLLFIGSCFSDKMGTFLEENRFNTLLNPFGTLFNPASIATALQFLLNPALFNSQWIDFFNEKWISFAHHGSFSHSVRDTFIQNIENQLDKGNTFLNKANFLFITFGTAYAYRHKKSNLIVANCHKIPAHKFNKIRLEVDEIVAQYQTLIAHLQQNNPNLTTIFTVSPVRHLGDGFHENQLSKSTLHLAIDEILKSCPKTFYFPSYEILQDDLRDYRFYGQDLCHPNEQAMNYIREIFSTAFFSSETEKKRKLIEKENKFLNHRPKTNS